MFDILTHFPSTAADAGTCLRGNPANVSAKMQELVPGDARTESTAWALIPAAASCLLFLCFLLLKATLNDVTNRHGSFLRPFLKITLLRPSLSTVDPTCPGHDKGSAATRQRDPTASHVSLQPSSTIRLAAAKRHNNEGKRPDDDGSDAEDNDRCKRPHANELDSRARVRCPFKVYYPNDPRYEKCGTYNSWTRLREHLLDRTHKPRDRCATCGETFFDDVEWDLHSSARLCEPSPRELERPFWVQRDQAMRIRNLAKQGCKTGPIEGMHREVCQILFGSEIAPGRTSTAGGHPTLSPLVEQTDDDSAVQQPWNHLKRAFANLIGMQNVPQDDFMQQVVHYVLSYLRDSGEQTHVVGNHETEAGEPAAAGHLGANEVVTEYWMPPATLLEGQMPQFLQPYEDAAGDLEGQLDDSLPALTAYLQGFEGAGSLSPPISLDPAHASSAGHNVEDRFYGTGYIDPSVLLQGTDANHTPPQVLASSSPAVHRSPTSTAWPPGSTASQASEATIVGSSSSQTAKDADYLLGEERGTACATSTSTLGNRAHWLGST